MKIISRIWEVLENASAIWLPGNHTGIIENFVIMIKSFASMLNNKNAYEVAVHVGKQTNLVKELFNDKSTEGVQRYENIQELLNSIKEWVDDQKTCPDYEDGDVVDTDAFADIPSPADLPTLFTDSEKPKEEPAQTEEKAMQNATLAAYLQQITLLTDADEKDPDADTVKLMTIHAAKGLEFGCVFAAGLEEMLFPNAMSINTREELEEERRLFYVVITRAKHRFWITYANTRYKFGQLVQNDPSRFIEELPEEYLDRSFAGGGLRNQGGGFGNSSATERMRGWGGASREAGVRSQQPTSSRQPAAGSRPSYSALSLCLQNRWNMYLRRISSQAILRN